MLLIINFGNWNIVEENLRVSGINKVFCLIKFFLMLALTGLVEAHFSLKSADIYFF